MARAALASHDWQACYDLVREPWAGDDAVGAERLDALAEASWWLGRLDECIDARQAAYRIFEDLGDRRRAGSCAVWLFEHHCMRAQPAIGTAWLRRASRVLDGDVGCAAYAALLLRQAEQAHGAGEDERAMQLTEQAHALARDLGSPDLEAEALQTRGRLLIDGGALTEGLAHLDEAMLFAVEGRLGPYSTGKVYCSLISACEELGDLRRAAEWTEATARWANQHPLAIFPGICRAHRAVVLERSGALADAEREATQACVELSGSHLPNAATAFAEAGDIRRRLGDLDGAELAFARVEEMTGRTCFMAALLRLAQGRVDAAQVIIADCLAEQAPLRPSRARLLATAVQIAVAAGDAAIAESALSELEALAATYDSAMFRALVALSRGRIQLAAHDIESATSSLRDALRRWQDLEVPYEVATTNTLLGQALLEAADRDGAEHAFAEATVLFSRIGAQLQGADGHGRSPRHPCGLTDREVQVLRLIAAGCSNKQIAVELHISAKTVARHLSNIFTKTSVTSRAAATAFAFERRLVR